MQAGKLRHLVTILQDAVSGKDDFGQEIRSESGFAQIYASIRPLSERELFQARQVHEDVTHVIRMRRIPGITAEMRILHEGRRFELAGPPLDRGERHIEIEVLAIERGAVTAADASFNPLWLPNLLLWLDANDISTVTTALEGSTVSFWRDKSGLNHNFSPENPTTANLATYKESIQNGRNINRFTGRDMPNFAGMSGQHPLLEINDFSCFLVLQNDFPTGSAVYLSLQYNITTGFRSGISFQSSGANSTLDVAITTSATTSSQFSTNTAVFGSEFILLSIVKSGDTLKIWKDGTLNGSHTGVPTAVTYGVAGETRSSVGSLFNNAGTFQSHATADEGEIILYGDGKSDTDRQSIESLLASNWGISL